MNDRAKRIKALIDGSGKTYIELEKITGIAKSSLQRYASGVTTKIPLDVLEKLESVFNVQRGYIMGWTEETNDTLQFDNIYPIQTKRFPLLGTVACGTPILAEENIELYVESLTDIKADFCLRCKGDSMINARINDGDIVFVKEQSTVSNGEIAVVIINNEATLKRVFFYPDREKLILQAENPRYEPFVYSGEELNEIRIIGKAIAFQSDVK